MSFKRKWIVLVREIRLLFTLRFLLFRVKSRPLSQVQENTRANLDFPFPFFLPLFSREISALKYSTRERLYPLRNLSMEYSKRSRCVTRAIGTGLECYPLETWWLETSRCWRDASFVDARRKSLDKQLSKCLESKNNIFEKLDPRFSSRTCWERRVDFEIT